MNGRQAQEARYALQQIGRKPIKVSGAYAVARSLQEINLVVEEIEKRRMSTIREHAILDDSGEVVLDDSNNAKFETPEDQAAFEEKFNELMSEEVDVEVKPLNMNDLGSVEVEPIILYMLMEAGILT